LIALVLLLLPFNLGSPLTAQPAGISRSFSRDVLDGDYRRID
jgi:hypothetical protein